MIPTDRVLVGVIKTKRDLEILLSQRWYRIPEGQAPNGVDAEYLAFFLSGLVFKERTGTIHYYAAQTGRELAYRKDLLPSNKPHRRDDHRYHKIQFAEILIKNPPIVNYPNSYRFAFILTTVDRFQRAEHIRDLYSKADYFVDRVFHVLRQKGLKPRRKWEASDAMTYPTGAQIRMIADRGEVIASTQPIEAKTHEELIYLSPSEYLEDAQASAEQIIDAVERLGGPKMVDIPVELY